MISIYNHHVQDSWVWYSSVCVFIVPTVIMVTTLALIFFQFYKNPTKEKLMTRGTRTSAANQLIGEVVQSRRRPLLGPSPG